MALSADSKAAGRWNTNRGGEYFMIGVGGAVTGKGADVLVIDDPHSEQDATVGAYNPDVYDKVYEWYTSGPRQRLQPVHIIIVMTRWSKRDLTGQIIKNSTQKEGSSEWEVRELPIMPSGNALWEEFWKKEELLSSKQSFQYQNGQHNISKTQPQKGALIKENGGKNG